jgi:hypothetical protein
MHVGGMFCDLANAFDCVNHEILLAKLHYYDLKEQQLTGLDPDTKNRNKIITEIFLKMRNSKTWSSSRVNFRAFAFYNIYK